MAQILTFNGGYKLNGVDVPFLNVGDISDAVLGKELTGEQIGRIIMVSLKKHEVYSGDHKRRGYGDN